ncbi:MAG: sigma factor-like helix-turn-helix DNA-binding protein [Bradymonadaceae bacterium]
MLNSLGEDDRKLMRLRFLEGKTFSEIGDVFGLTRQRMRQKTGDYLDRLRGHYEGVARGLIGALLHRMEAGAGLVHRSQVELWTGCNDLYSVLLTALLLDEGAYIWSGHFLANQASTRLERGPVAEVRRRIADSDRMRVPIREVVSYAREAGIGVDPEGARGTPRPTPLTRRRNRRPGGSSRSSKSTRKSIRSATASTSTRWRCRSTSGSSTTSPTGVSTGSKARPRRSASRCCSKSSRRVSSPSATTSSR